MVPIEAVDIDQWLTGTVEEAHTLLKLAPFEIFDTGLAVDEEPETVLITDE